ncbi:hypothetical protein [Prauserella rugosa]|uniref:Uncharacterized protein n=1 Tax=Prauserella rugosa TaxID=43354 RepID=A0A660CBE5_9PSEU|nr:hypothetical protein [Prauserella rugosa]KID32133.1 hypothetical protein HQ32_01017 [Prauserella sp. Am3]KMS91911.1 hypothetical protein ACZ91_07065 [Streptomyces regensis]TWH20626.1 hypothetical protein JD82_02473 [Prauserella rugosa]
MNSDGTEQTNATVATDPEDAQGTGQDGEQIREGNSEHGGDRDVAPEGTPQEPDSEWLLQPAATVPPTAAAGSGKGSGSGVLGGIAVVSTGLGLSSLIGNPLSEMLRARQEIMGQIEAGMGGAGSDQIESFYGAPWHTTALVNGVIALVAAVIGAVVLLVHTRRSDARPWVTALAVGGLVLGLIGLVLAGGMYLDLFASQPELPAAPPMAPGG